MLAVVLMTVEQTDVVDFVSVNRADGRVVLTVSDHLSWEDDEHLLTLQEKLNAYISFVESGQLLRDYPDATDRAVRIEIVCKYPPSELALKFLNLVRGRFDEMGVELSHEILPDD